MVRRTFFESDFEAQLRRRLQGVSSQAEGASPVPSLPLDDGPTEEPAQSAQPEGHRASIDVQETLQHHLRTSLGAATFTGNALLCICPDCEAPLTLRSWLKLADCWRCGASIQLDFESISELPPVELPPANEASAPLPTGDIEALVEPEPDEDAAAPISAVADERERELERLTRSNRAAELLRTGFNSMPAWLISFLLHLILILLLALIMLGQSESPPTITLSTFFRHEKAEGGEVRIENPRDTLVDDLLMAQDLEVDDDEIRDVIQQAEQEAQELREDPAPLAPLPDLDRVKRNITTRQGPLMSFAARDPRVRAEIVRREGGTSLTEAAVARGLRWLASVQNDDGSWSLARYDRHDRPGNEGDAAATSLALLPFLGAGQTHEFGIYKQTVARGLAWLLDRQKPNGDLRADFPGDAGMYAHGQAAIVVCEALAMTGDERFRLPAQKAIDFIESAQHVRGGWRYQPGQAGDTSILGWQLMAIQSARAPQVGLEVDEDMLKLADSYLSDAAYQRSVAGMPTGSLYKYLPERRRPTAPMTAEALLCRMYLGWSRDDPRVMAGVRWLIDQHPPDEDDKNIYYWYYGTQVMHHYGGRPWERWNRRMRELLVASQEKKGPRAGSWNPRGYQWGSQGGRIYVTSLAVCTLEVYYRHLPLFQQIQFEESGTQRP